MVTTKRLQEDVFTKYPRCKGLFNSWGKFFQRNSDQGRVRRIRFLSESQFQKVRTRDLTTFLKMLCICFNIPFSVDLRDIVTFSWTLLKTVKIQGVENIKTRTLVRVSGPVHTAPPFPCENVANIFVSALNSHCSAVEIERL